MWYDLSDVRTCLVRSHSYQDLQQGYSWMDQPPQSSPQPVHGHGSVAGVSVGGGGGGVVMELDLDLVDAPAPFSNISPPPRSHNNHHFQGSLTKTMSNSSIFLDVSPRSTGVSSGPNSTSRPVLHSPTYRSNSWSGLEMNNAPDQPKPQAPSVR
jgi:hypothetical protein